MRFPGVDERLIAPESRAEVLDGRVVFAPPADEKHAVPHADLAYVLRAHVRDGYAVAVDMLTRTSETNDFASDASVFEAARDPVTGGRRLEELAFEVVNEQALAIQTTKARELVRRGVRRMFCIVVKQAKLLEWSKTTDAWAATPLETIDDRCFARPLPSAALLGAAAADAAVLRALRAKGHPEFDAVREEGREEGREEAMRELMPELCELYGIALDEERRGQVAALSAAELDALVAVLRRDRRWPS